jgi:hypothetical protein
MRYFALIGALFLGACVTGDQGYGYMKASGRTNLEKMQLTLAQCQGEGAATPPGFYVEGGGLVGFTGALMVRAAQVDSVTSACMARHGYVPAQPAPPR